MRWSRTHAAWRFLAAGTCPSSANAAAGMLSYAVSGFSVLGSVTEYTSLLASLPEAVSPPNMNALPLMTETECPDRARSDLIAR